MASVVLTQAILSLASDPSKQVAAYTSDRSDVLSLPGEVRRMANGRLRTVSRTGTARTLGVTFRLLTPAQVATVLGWTGRTVLFRDVTGRKMYGAFFTPETVDRRDRSGQDVKLTLSEVSFIEAV